MKKVKITLDIGEVLRELLRRDEEYWAAYRAWREEKPLALTGPARSYPERDELHDRPVLRRR